jgi:hypothetical protein
MYVLGLYAAALMAALVHPRQRRTAAGRALAVAALGSFCIFWLLDGSKTSGYLTHTLPWLLLLSGFGIRRLFPGQAGLVTCLLVILAVGQAVAFFGWRRDAKLQNEANATVNYLKRNVEPGERLTGGAEYGLLAGGSLYFTDDPRLGYLTGNRPAWVVVSPWYHAWIEANRKRDPAFDRYVGGLLDEGAREVFHAGRVKVFRVAKAAR